MVRKLVYLSVLCIVLSACAESPVPLYTLAPTPVHIPVAAPTGTPVAAPAHENPAIPVLLGYEDAVEFGDVSFVDSFSMTIAYRGGALEPIYPLLAPDRATFLLDGAEIGHTVEQGLDIWLTPEEQGTLTTTPGDHRVEKTLEIRVLDSSATNLEVPLSVHYPLFVENVVSTTLVLLPNGRPFGPSNPHLLFENQSGVTWFNLPEIPPGDVEALVTQKGETRTVHRVERGFSVLDDGAGGSIVAFSARQVAEGRYDQLAVVAANFDGQNLQDATLARLKGVNVAPAVRAITLGAYYRPDDFERYLVNELSRIAELGANYVGMAVVWYMEDKFASEVRPAPSTWEPGQFGITHSDADIERFANAAHELGLRVSLSIQLVCDFGLEHCWAGSIQPQDQAQWDASYTDYVITITKLAQTLGIERLTVANELKSMQRREDFMLALIDQVRQVYDGEIMIGLGMWGGGKFGGDMGHKAYGNVPVSVLQAVDYVGLNLYVSGASAADATVEEMVKSMIPQMDSAARYYQSLGVNHLTITEAGSSIMDGGAIVPWKVKFPVGTSLDLQEQADYYAAFFQALRRSQLGPLVTGVTFWAWDLARETLKDGDLGARRLSIARNHLVHQVLAAQWGGDVSPWWDDD
jgi:hypothetical protein